MIDDEVKRWEYSAIMDEETCAICSELDGLTAVSAKELPPAPNPKCTAAEGCRCFHVGIIV